MFVVNFAVVSYTIADTSVLDMDDAYSSGERNAKQIYCSFRSKNRFFVKIS